MKYIDADRLCAEIEHLKCVQRTIGDRAINSSMRRFYEGTEDMCNQFLSLIDSLQQEQPEKTLTFDGFVDKVGTWFANLRLNKFRKTFNGEIFPATQLVQEYDLFVRELSKTYSDKQEQPEKESEKRLNQDELEEEISRTYHNGSVADTSDMDHVDYENIARHFAQWGAEHLIK